MSSNSVKPEYQSITSTRTLDYFTKDHFKNQVELIKKASEEAQKKVDYDTAHNDDILYAIEIVEKFLRKSGRICYGGQAINAHLPKAHKIYDPSYSIPDYDFFTPNSGTDVIYLTKMLQKAGFAEVSTREGMHEGTTKIYVNYIPVADITALHSKIYDILHKRSKTFDGIRYMDANSLRMLMYLELSRPRGEVGRWSKVFERLMVFNEFIPVKHCKIYQRKVGVSPTHINIIVKYVIENKRIFAGADLVEFYDHSAFATNNRQTKLHITTKKPILFFSPNSYDDAKKLITLLRSVDHKKFTIQTITIQKTDMVPYFTMIKQGKRILACIIEYSACHSYITVSSANSKIKVASLDTLITLYFSLGLIKSHLFKIGSMECMASKLVEISIKTRKKYGIISLPFVSIECEGHQKTLPSLIREKVSRITQKKTNEKRTTIKRSNVKRR